MAFEGLRFRAVSFDGRFKREDVISKEGRIIDVRIIKARLAARNYALLAPRHLRGALTGLGELKGGHFGLVPLKSRNHLRLSYLRQEELKSMILDIFKGDFHCPAIDLEKQYSDHYRRVRQETLDLQELKSLEAHIRELLKKNWKRSILLGRLPVLWEALEERFKKRREAFEQLQARRVKGDGRTEKGAGACQGYVEGP